MSLFTGESINFANTDLGTNSIKGIYVVSKAVDPASITNATSAETSVNIPGVNVGDIVIVNVPASLETGLVFSGVRVSAANTIALRLSCIAADPVDGASRTWVFKIFKLS